MAQQLEGKRGHTRADDAPPHCAHVLRIPIARARKAVVIMGRPAGKIGVRPRAKAIAAMARMRSESEVSLGQTSPRKAAGTAASSPHEAGFPIDWAPSAPARVNMFQNRKTPMPVSQNPDLIAVGPRLSCDRATPVDSSMVMWAANIRLIPLTLIIGAIRSPYSPLRKPRRVAVAIPDRALPPDPITPTSANWDAPEKVSRESRHVCKIENPAATPAAPKAMP